MKKVNKLLFVSHLYPSGMEPTRSVFNHELIKNLRNVCEVKVIAPYFWFPGKRSLPKKEEIDGIEVIHPRVAYFPGLLIHMHWRLYRLFVSCLFRKVILEFQPDHVMIGFAYPDATAMAYLCRESGLEYSVRINGSDFYTRIKQGKFRGLVLDELMKAPRIFCPGAALKDAMIQAGIDGYKITAFDNGVDGSVFKYRSRKEAEQLILARQTNGSVPSNIVSHHAGERIILFVGNLVPVKNPKMLIRAFADLVKSRVAKELCRGEEVKGVPGVERVEGITRVSGKEDANKGRQFTNNATTNNNCQKDPVLLIIGGGPLKRGLEEKAERLGVSENVYFLGPRPHDEVALWMNVADCLCLCSNSEGMPNVVLEALVSGLPVVATDVGECRRLLSGDVEAELVPPANIEALTVALRNVLEGVTDKKARAVIYEGKYSWSRAAEEILNSLARTIHEESQML